MLPAKVVEAHPLTTGLEIAPKVKVGRTSFRVSPASSGVLRAKLKTRLDADAVIGLPSWSLSYVNDGTGAVTAGELEIGCSSILVEAVVFTATVRVLRFAA